MHQGNKYDLKGRKICRTISRSYTKSCWIERQNEIIYGKPDHNKKGDDSCLKHCNYSSIVGDMALTFPKFTPNEQKYCEYSNLPTIKALLPMKNRKAEGSDMIKANIL